LIYEAYQARDDLLAPFRAAAEVAAAMFDRGRAGPFGNLLLRTAAAGTELFARAKLVHERPPFGIEAVVVGEREALIVEDAALETPFATLLHFKKDIALEQPRVLVVAPMAGHFATLLRDTVRSLLPDNDVYITDWHNARDIPRSDGKFELDDYIDHIIKFFEHIGPGAHVVGVCQPCNALLAAIAVMAETGNIAQPRSMTLMAGPVDARVNPTAVNELATSHSIEWFEENLIATVPHQFRGANRRVYPGFLQVAAFMSMNLPRHIRAHLDLFSHIAHGEIEKADATRRFYDEYFAVLDLPAEFYLQTVQRVFQEHRLARGLFEWRGNRIDIGAIKKVALLTIEGEKDDICAPGQTVAAHDLCTGIKAHKKHHHLQPGVGHYGVFSGTKWQRQIYPLVRDIIRMND
jgi:polyhydroxyalkanoate depolymerase